MLQMITQVSKIQFGILSDQDIMNMSVCSIDNPSLTVEDDILSEDSKLRGHVYDPRLGCVNSKSICVTCKEDLWNCTGHFGHINLCVPIILFYKQAVSMLKLFCFSCHRLLCSEEDLAIQDIKSYDRIVNHVSKMSFCGHCNTPHPDIRYDIGETKIFASYRYKSEKTYQELFTSTIKQIFDGVSDQDCKLLGIDPTMFHPRNLVLTKFPVIPICCRPRMITTDNVSDDDLSISLVEIIKSNNLLKSSNLSDDKYEKVISDIKFRTLTYCDNSRGKAVHNTNHKPLSGIKERITKKTGHVRQNLMGKRRDKTARSVLGPDSTLKLNEVAIPPEIANVLTIPVYVNEINREELSILINLPGKASTITTKNASGKLVTRSVATMAKQVATLQTNEKRVVPQHGDVLLRDGKEMTVMNCKMQLRSGDKIKPYKKKEFESITFAQKPPITLNIGDRVEFFLKDGDFVLLNRQPTLHKSSMQAMKVVVKPGKTIRINLALTNAYNMDFDGYNMDF